MLSLDHTMFPFRARFLLILAVMGYYSQTEDEKEMVSRTVYCTNIDKKVCKPIFLSMHVVANL